MADKTIHSEHNTPSSYLVNNVASDDTGPPAIGDLSLFYLAIPDNMNLVEAMGNDQAHRRARPSAQVVDGAAGEQAEQVPAIPLLCHVCPAKPGFSDLSHLLTHLNSKSHLAQKHQMKLESFSDPDARVTLDLFKAWKREHKINTLLAERYADKKKKGNASAMVALPIQRLRASFVGAAGPSPLGRGRNSVASMMSPQSLNGIRQMSSIPLVKDEPMDEFNLRQPAPVAPAMNRSWMSSQFSLPPLNTGGFGTQMHSSSFGPYQSIDAMAGSGYSATPHGRRGLSNNRNIFNESSPAIDEPGSVIETIDGIDEVVDFHEGVEPKLKGAFWPGMGLFDSATQEQKRKRNQRKNPQVLENMKRYSEMVQPVYTRWRVDGSGWDQDAVRGIEDAPSEIGSEYESNDDEPVIVTKSAIRKRKTFNIKVKREPDVDEGAPTRTALDAPKNENEDLSIANFSLRSNRQNNSYEILNDHPSTPRFGVAGFPTPTMKLENSSSSHLSADRAASPLDGYNGSSRLGYSTMLQQPFSRPTQFGINPGFNKSYSTMGSPIPSARHQLRGYTGQTMLSRSITAANGYLPNTANTTSMSAAPISASPMSQSRSFGYSGIFNQTDDSLKPINTNAFQTSGLTSNGFQSNGGTQTGFPPNPIPANGFQSNGMNPNGSQTSGGGTNGLQSTDMNSNGFQSMGQNFNNGITQADMYNAQGTSDENHIM